MTQVISIINHKGGVGKTTSTMNLGSAINIMGYKVLLIDIDPQSNLTQSFGFENKYEKNIYDSITNFIERDTKNLFPVSIRNNFDLVCSSLDLSASETELINEAGREYILNELIEPIKKNYDYILIDCPPSLGVLTINALTTSDKVIIPVQSEYLALKGMIKLLSIIEKIQKRLNKNLLIRGIFINQYEARLNLHKNIEQQLKDNMNDKLLNTKIRKNISLAEAQSDFKDIFTYAPNSIGAEDYMELAKEII